MTITLISAGCTNNHSMLTDSSPPANEQDDEFVVSDNLMIDLGEVSHPAASDAADHLIMPEASGFDFFRDCHDDREYCINKLYPPNRPDPYGRDCGTFQFVNTCPFSVKVGVSPCAGPCRIMLAKPHDIITLNGIHRLEHPAVMREHDPDQCFHVGTVCRPGR